jgi:coenzyme F420-0:L-glutamate ligase/coenzyme F420-1:gamma-L-glutamate ligase
VSPRLEIEAPDGVGEVEPGADLAGLLLSVCTPRDGDVVTVTSKVVSKAEGRFVDGTREDALPGETVRVVARRGPTTIVRNRQGLTMAAAGIDASNVTPGRVLVLPEDPDASARRLREAIRELTGTNVGVLVTDTAGRAWREGQTDIAIGAAGVVVAEDYAGRTDGHGNPLLVSAPAVADELAGAAELASGKLGGRPFAVIRGRADLVLPAGDHGTGAAALVRADGADLFGFGSREAVVAALAGRDLAVFGAPAEADDLARALREVTASADVTVHGEAEVTAYLPTDARDRAIVVGRAFGWSVEEGDQAGKALDLRFHRTSP